MNGSTSGGACPTDASRAENAAAVALSIEDFKNGERGAVVSGHSARLRREFGLADP